MKTHLTYLIIILLLFGFLIHTCNRKNEIKASSESTTAFLNDSVKYYKNKYGQEIAYKKALRGENSTLQVLLSKQIDSTEQLKKLVEKFKNVDAAGNITTITRIDTIHVPYEVPLPYVFEREWEKSEKFYFVSGRSTHFGNTIDKLEVPVPISFAIGDKKIGLFKSEYRFEATSENPYTTITGLDGYTHKSSESILSVGLQAGYGMTSRGLGAYVGAGFNFDLWLLFKKL